LVRANGRPPAAVSMAVEPSTGPRVLVGATFGLLITTDGANWRWVCEQSVYAGGAFGVDDPRYRLSATGTIYAGLPSGLTLSRDGGCSFMHASGAVATANIGDVAMSPVDAQTVYAVTASVGVANGFYISHDDGLSFTLVGTPDPTAFFRRVVAVGVDAWVSGFDNVGAGHHRLLRYAGALGTVTGLQPTGLDQTGPVADLVAGSSSALYLASQDPPALFKSTDGGGTWAQVFSAPILRAAWLDASEGLWLATGTGITESHDSGATFTPVSPELLTCLGGRPGVLFGCSPSGSSSAFQRSADGASWTSILRLDRDIVGVLSCPAGTPTHDLCEPLWPSLRTQLGLPGPLDAGSADGAETAKGGGAGCGCEVAEPRTGGLAGLALVAWFLGGRNRLRRRGGEASPR
jgi:hypothetical protein